MVNFCRYCFLVFCFLSAATARASAGADSLSFFSADNPLYQYTGRIDFSNPLLPRFWSPGVYISAKFKGTFCEVQLNDQQLWGSNQNYLQIVIDGKQQRIKTSGRYNRIVVARDLENTEHTIVICKNTESNIGYLEFIGLTCAELLPLPAMPTRKIEFIGNSITCGTGSDPSLVACGKGVWHDQHNAYLSYGALTARSLNAQWSLTAASGIGLVRSCCNMEITMPEVFDKIDLRGDSLPWHFSKYQPSVVTVCLGQNDGAQDSTFFCTAFVSFIAQLRTHYPAATLVLLNSPMADDQLTLLLKKYLLSVANTCKKMGDNNVTTFFFSKRYSSGCDSHPDLQEHAAMAGELSAAIKSIMHW